MREQTSSFFHFTMTSTGSSEIWLFSKKSACAKTTVRHTHIVREIKRTTRFAHTPASGRICWILFPFKKISSMSSACKTLKTQHKEQIKNQKQNLTDWHWDFSQILRTHLDSLVCSTLCWSGAFSTLKKMRKCPSSSLKPFSEFSFLLSFVSSLSPLPFLFLFFLSHLPLSLSSSRSFLPFFQLQKINSP